MDPALKRTAPWACLALEGELASLVRRPDPGPYRIDPSRRASVKDVLESLGVPHTEVYGLRADGREVDFGHIPVAGEDLRAFPATRPVDVSWGGPLRPGLAVLRFVVDENVAKLATLLRILGFDAFYERGLDDAGLARLASREGRVLLSRDRALLKRREVAWGRLVRAVEPLDQLGEVLALFGAVAPAPFSRCLRCNAELAPVDKAAVLHLLEPKTRRYYEVFSRCPACGRIYWAGSHQEHMRGVLAGLGLLPPDREGTGAGGGSP